ncbi:MAG: methyltransferase domain-containing protein [Chloroflexi bacterium]|nr:methyltransferase domain-containing protein [Chloroflexota bacterium]
MKPHEDAYGREIYDYFTSGEGIEIVEREDGFLGTSMGPSGYFSEFPDWSPHLQEAISLAQGRILDVGCGAGRFAIYLQEEGHEVVGIDNSPLAVEVCRQRGVKDARIMSINQASKQKLGRFDSIIMMGNNFGLFGSPRRAKWLLRRFYGMTGANGRIIAESNDPYQTNKSYHLAYHERNRRRGRMSGQLRIRVRYLDYIGQWFDYLFVSREEMQDILAGTGWRVSQFIDSESPSYIAIIEKD